MLRLIICGFVPCHTSLIQLAQCQGLSVMLMGLLAFRSSAAIGLLVGIPEPKIHDEFSYLLAADTFAHGRRVTRPIRCGCTLRACISSISLPMLEVPPAQGLVLAAGQVISGTSIMGVWFSIGLMGAAICWMLYAWLPPQWAVLADSWGSTPGHCWILGPKLLGGAVAATGGALVFGALRRIMSGQAYTMHCSWAQVCSPGQQPAI